MTTSPDETQRRLSRAENDVSAIYDMLTDIKAVQGQHSTELAAVHDKLAEHDRRFDGIDQRFDGIDQRFDGIDQRFDGIDQRFDGIEGTLAEVLRRLPEAG